MKKNLVLLLLAVSCLCSVNAFAADDTYRPMFKEGKVWEYYYTNGFYEGSLKYYISGDSIVDGEKCYKLYMILTELQTDRIVSEGYLGLCREKDRKVYQRKRTNPTGEWAWLLLYDFNMKEGDTQVVNSELKVTVETIDEVSVKGRNFRRLTVREDDEYKGWSRSVIGYWVEGVGSSVDFVYPYVTYSSMKLLYCYEDGECIFTKDDFNRKSGETDGIETPTNAFHQSVKGTYDLQGRRVVSTPRRGIYIKEGKKYVVK